MTGESLLPSVFLMSRSAGEVVAFDSDYPKIKVDVIPAG